MQGGGVSAAWPKGLRMPESRDNICLPVCSCFLSFSFLTRKEIPTGFQFMTKSFSISVIFKAYLFTQLPFISVSSLLALAPPQNS